MYLFLHYSQTREMKKTKFYFLIHITLFPHTYYFPVQASFVTNQAFESFFAESTVPGKVNYMYVKM